MFKCMECGRKFRTAKAAERAAFSDRGCPGCGGSDIDIDTDAVVRKTRKTRRTNKSEPAVTGITSLLP